MTSKDAVAGIQRLLIDTDAVIFLLEKHAEFAPRVWLILHEAVTANTALVISPLTLVEVLSKPGLTADELKHYAEFCLATQEIEFTPIAFDDAFAIRVGFFRRTTNVKTPDCIQFACAERLHCDAILTNNGTDYRRHPSVRCVVISEVDP